MKRRYRPLLSPIVSNESLDSQISQLSLRGSQNSSTSWLLKNFHESDLELVNKSCSLNRVNVTSNYWKVPDNTMYLTSLAIKKNNDEDEQDAENVRMAISSGGSENNLFIYDLDLVDSYLTHQSTISLANIHALKWIPQTENLMVTGNDKGYAHLVSIPDANSEDSAEICKRFNHRKHLKSINKPTSNDYYFHTSIKRMSLNNGNRELLTIYDTNLFHWDLRDAQSQLKPSPILITPIPGLINMEPIMNAPNQIGVCGKFGVSLMDLREHKFSVPKRNLSVKEQHNLQCNMMRWKPNDANVFSGAHRDGVVRLWDIRKEGESIGNLNAHNGKITSMEWNNGDLFTGGKDGNIIFWDLTDSSADLSNCGVKQGLESVQFNPKTNSVENVLNQTQCGTVLPASNTNVVGMTSVSQRKEGATVLSIDGSSYLGVHKRLQDEYSIDTRELALYYSKEELKLMQMSEAGNGGSSNTLVDGCEKVCETEFAPLAPAKLLLREEVIDVDDASHTFGLGNKNMSSDTLCSLTMTDSSYAHQLLDPGSNILAAKNISDRPLTPTSVYSDDGMDNLEEVSVSEVELDELSSFVDSDTKSVVTITKDFDLEFMSPGTLLSDDSADSVASPVSVATEGANGSVETLDTLYSLDAPLHRKTNLVQSTFDCSKFKLELDFEDDEFDFSTPLIMA